MTNEKAREYVWNLIKKNYVNKGVKYFWLDVAEPGYSVYDFDNYRYKRNRFTNWEFVSNRFLSMISEGLGNNQSVVTLVRGGWAGAQRWSFVMVRRY